MSFASKHNKGSKFDVNIEGFEFRKLSELEEGAVYQICGLYINTKGKFDDHPVAMCTDELLVDLPPHMTEDVRAMIASDEDVEDIKKGKVGFKIRKYHSKAYDRECVGVEWVDILEK